MAAIHAATAPELVTLRTYPQASKVRCAIVTPPIVFQALINQTFTAWDCIYEITYDTVTTGAYTDLQLDMELWVGTSAGACDVGKCRIRKAADATKIYIGETSEVKFMNNYYLTGVLDFLPHARHLRVLADGTTYMDYDVAYTDQYRFWKPVPILGTHAVAKLTGANVTVRFDASDSYAVDDSLWKCEWTALGGGTKTEPGGTNLYCDFTYTAAGVYWVKCLVHSFTNDKTQYAYRCVYVWSEAAPPPSVVVGSLSADMDAGWNAQITAYSGVGQTIPDRAMCVLFTEDYAGGAAITPPGQITNRENILLTGWARGETVTENLNSGKVSFDIAGLAWWLQNRENFPVGVEYHAGTGHSSAWTDIEGLTVPRGLVAWLTWRTTLTQVTDCYYPTGTPATLLTPSVEAPKGDAWTQLGTFCNDQILARPACDRFGRLFVEIDPNNTPLSERSGIVTVMTITKADRSDTVEFEHVTTPRTSFVDISGINFKGGTLDNADTFFAIAPGHIDKDIGKPIKKDRLLFQTQAYARTMAGMLLASGNNPFPNIPVVMPQNNRMIDIAPRQYCSLTLLAADNPRGVGYSGLVIPRTCSIEIDEDGKLTIEVGFEAAVTEDISSDGDKPNEDDNNPDFSEFPPLPPLPPLPFPPFPVSGIPRFGYMVTPGGLVYYNELDSLTGLPIWKPCTGAVSTAALQETKVFFGSNRAGRLYFGTTTGGLYSCLMGEQMQAAEAPAITQAWAFGVDDNAADIVAFSGRDFTTAIDGLYVGGALITFALGTAYPEQAWDYHGLTYNLGKWLAVYPELLYNPVRVLRISGDGGTIELNDTITPNTATILYTKHAGYSGDKTFIIGRSSALTNGGADETALVGIVLEDEEGIASEPTGTTILAREDTAAVPKISIDSGASWSTIATFPKATGAYYSAIQWVNASQWVWAAGTFGASGDAGVFITQDNSATWIDITSNLYDLLGPDFSPRYIRCWL